MGVLLHASIKTNVYSTNELRFVFPMSLNIWALISRFDLLGLWWSGRFLLKDLSHSHTHLHVRSIRTQRLVLDLLLLDVSF